MVVKAKVKSNYKPEADRIAAERGGRCLTLGIPTIQSKANWKCFNPNHPEWTASFASVRGHRSRRGAWCKRCFRERFRKMRRLSTIEVRERLRQLGIELVSKKYTGINDLIDCRCVRCDHPWPTRLRHINHGHGCLSERLCRAAAEQIFGDRFKKTPLHGVRGIGGRELELDGYSASLKLAFEHNGAQHFQPVRFGNQTEIEAVSSFRKQQEHDRRRREFCRSKGITLIEIPELGRRTKIKDLKEFIRAECQKANFELPEGFDGVHLKLDAHNLVTTAEQMWDRVLKRVRELGYTLNSTSYPGANGRLDLICKNGHPYKPRVANFLRWACRDCLIQKLSIPVVTLPLGKMQRKGDYQNARVFDSIEECAKALKASSNSVRTVANGRGNSCMGFGVTQITPDQAECFRKSREKLDSFCQAKWPSPETYDRQDGSRKRLSKPVMFSDGREFPSKAAAARALGVTKAAIYHATRIGNLCRGHSIREAQTK